MFTIEMDWDETTITVLDPDDEHEDLEVAIFDDIIYMRQWDEDLLKYTYIVLSPNQYLQFMRSFSLPAGAYMLNQGDQK